MGKVDGAAVAVEMYSGSKSSWHGLKSFSNSTRLLQARSHRQIIAICSSDLYQIVYARGGTNGHRRDVACQE
jgi:hypothetical protein